MAPLSYHNSLTDEIIPWLAESFDSNDDFAEVAVELRDGATWSDGQAFDAEDVVYTCEMLLENGKGLYWLPEHVWADQDPLTFANYPEDGGLPGSPARGRWCGPAVSRSSWTAATTGGARRRAFATCRMSNASSTFPRPAMTAPPS
ncbi:ABC transporter substrate-binding protein [Fluviibacterium sp. DFM31]|uniref:ABC transporter substrate-binding protein n=1 Tax=Meridianimarinicoccus marinus TaxID=3231483 RepID=A0ABV3LA15_9RHOB